MLLDRYLPRIEFDSYEDFKENYRVNLAQPRKRRTHLYVYRYFKALQSDLPLFPQPRTEERRCCVADSSPSLGILGDCDRIA
jgi:hypothetical protein